MEKIIFNISDILWSAPMIIFCIGAGLFFTLSTRFVQIRYIKETFRQILKGEKSDEGISSFQSLVLTLSGRIGTGNIVGVATAIAFGGPGALFWMWVIAFFGASLSFVESTLGQIYKVRHEKGYRGGPAYYIEKGIGSKKFAIFISITAIISHTIFMPGLQSNTITSSMNMTFNIPINIMAFILVISLIFIFKGGVKSFAKFAEIVVPIMSIIYILIAIIIILVNFRQIPYIFSLIISSAFGRNELFGGIVGSAINFGVRRGMFSSEAGQGSQVSSAAAAETKHPVNIGFVQAFSVYIDTLVVSTATGLMILMTGMYNVIDTNGEYIVKNLPYVNEVGPEFTIYAIDSVFMGLGSTIVTLAIFLFAFTIFISDYYIAETNLYYIYKGKHISLVTIILKVIFLSMVFLGAYKSSDMVWAMADLGMGVNVWINLVAIIMLYKPLMLCFRDYEKQYKEGKDPIFNSKKVGIKNADFWEDK